MRKLLLLFIALLTGVSGAWAADGYITVKIADGSVSNGPATYGDANSGPVSTVTFKSTWTSTALSGIAELTLTAKTSADVAYNALAEETSYGSFHCLGFKPSAGNATDILTITAPSGYIITGYYIEAGYWTSGQNYTLTAGAGTGTTSYTTSAAPNNGRKGLEVSGINATSTTISIKSNQAANDRCLMMNKFTVTIFPKELYDAEASITSGRLYRIFTKNNGTAEGDTKYYLTTSGTLTTETASAGQFLFNATTTTTNCYVPAGYAWKISNGNNRFTNRPSNAPGQTHLNTTSGNNRDTYEAQVFYLNGGKYAVRSTNFDGSGSQYVQNSYWTVVADITGDGVPDATYDDTEGTKHYVWQLEEVVSVTFNLIYEGNTIASTGPLDNSDGSYNGTAALPTDAWSNPYCSYSYSPTTITSGTRTVNVTMTWEGPFTISSDYASATWTYLKLRGKYAKYDKDLTITSDVAYPLYSNKSDVRYTDEGLWAFVGNPIQGVRLFNKAAGSGKCIQWTTQPQMDVTSKGNAVYWKIGKLDGYGFLLNYGGFYLHDLGSNVPGKLGIWNGGGAPTDPGSAFVVEDLDWRDKAVFAVQDYANTHTINVYFGTDETVYNATINTVKSYAGDFSEEMYNGIITSLNNGELLLYPATGNYIIKHPYDSSQQGANVYLAANASGIYLKTGIDASNIVRVENNNDGTLNLAFQGKYVGDAPSAYAQFPLVNDAVAFNFDVLDAGNIGLHHSEGTHVYLWHGNEADKAVKSWVGGNSGYKWQIEDIDEGLSVTLNNGGDGNYYATFCAPFSYTVGSGTKAYTLAQSGDWLIPTEVEGTVAAGTPVLLKGTSPTATLTVGTDWAAAPLTSTALTGTYLATTIDGTTDYVLGINEGVVGFYHWDSNNLGANRAYLDTPAAGVKGFVINWGYETKITETTEKTETTKAMFDLSGRRVSKAQKGLYIQNGKKVMVK